jgi:hypothetical protein
MLAYIIHVRWLGLEHKWCVSLVRYTSIYYPDVIQSEICETIEQRDKIIDNLIKNKDQYSIEYDQSKPPNFNYKIHEDFEIRL